ncbi:MAG: alcohol dehydrogenase catalytic domain-containing protein [Armatimonadota bacterium]
MPASGPSLPKTMKAIVTRAPGDYRLEEVPTPTAEAGEVVIKLHACGVCAGDAKCYEGAPMFWGDDTRARYVQPPCIPGHEFVGDVVQLGEGAGDKYGLEIGDLAISEQIVPCWKCRLCKRGNYWMCVEAHVYGFRPYVNGGMAEYMKFPAAAINYKVPSDMPTDKGALIEPLSCSIHAVQRGEIDLGDVVVVAGCGTLGLGMVGVAKLQSPGLLIATDMMDNRLELAAKIGADLTINPGKEDAVQRVLDLTEGYGCDVYIEATGHPSGVEMGLQMIRRMGTFVEFSVMPENVSVDWSIIGDTKELNIHGAHLGPYVYPLAIKYIHEGIVDVEGIVTHSFPLEQFEDAFAKVASAEESIKVVLEP